MTESLPWADRASSAMPFAFTHVPRCLEDVFSAVRRDAVLELAPIGEQRTRQGAARRLCNPSKGCHVRKVARLLARPLTLKPATRNRNIRLHPKISPGLPPVIKPSA